MNLKDQEEALWSGFKVADSNEMYKGAYESARGRGDNDKKFGDASREEKAKMVRAQSMTRLGNAQKEVAEAQALLRESYLTLNVDH